MKKEKVFIVLSLKHVLKTPAREDIPAQWDRVETVEFVSQLRTRHHTSSSAIGDYINRKMLTGARVGMDNYDTFETYIRSKYEKEMKQLDDAYENDRVPTVNITNIITDEFGNIRPRTVFDKEI